MKAPAFQFYADDFLAGTADMTDSEAGLYIRLLCAQWSRGSLPGNVDELLRFSRGSTTLEAERVRQKFEVGEDGRLRNARLEKERQKQAEWREKSRIGGLKSAKSRGVSTTLQPPLEPPLEPNGQPNGNSPVSSLQSPTIQEAPSASRFEEFWSVYPKKVAKEQSKLKFDRLKPVDQEAAIQGAARDSGSDQWRKENGQYIPNPATYINQRRWETVISINTTARRDSSGMTDEEILRAAL